MPFEVQRGQWVFGHGYCGETSVQMIAAYHGVWVSQWLARELGGGELLLNNNLEGVVQQLGFALTSWDWDAPATRAYRDSYMVWIKRQLIAGKHVIFVARLKGSQDKYYDHIMPAYGITYNSATQSRYDPSDELMWTDAFEHDIKRAMGAPGFFAPRYKCPFGVIKEGEGGCIPSGVPTWASTMGGLQDANGLFRRLQFSITRWSDGTQKQREPNTRGALKVKGDYQLDLSTAGIAAGQVFTVFRCDGAGSVPENPVSIQALYNAPRCGKHASFVMSSEVAGPLNQEQFGVLWSASIVYFVCVLGK